MVWDYLSSFWSKIVDVGSYTIDWFQGVGNAVAGAIGGFFDATFHLIGDMFLVVGWFFSYMKQIFLALVQPFNYIFLFLKSFISQAFTTPANEVSEVLSPEITSLFQGIPYWEILSTILGALILFFVGFTLSKSISKTL